MISPQTSKRLEYLHSSVGLNEHQLSLLSGYDEASIQKAALLGGWAFLKGWKRDRNVRLAMVGAEQRDLYFRQAARITNHLRQRYNIGPYNLTLTDAFSAFSSSPIDLRFVCHPANCLAEFTTVELKHAIRAFEQQHGKVEFPSHFRYDYKERAPVDTKRTRVLGFDPGSKNFGCFAGEILEGSHPTSIFKLKSAPQFSLIPFESSMLQHPIVELKGQNLSNVSAFSNEMRSYIDCYEPHSIVIERFMSRGLKGKTIELISVMVGILASLVLEYKNKGRPITLISATAASWKNRVNSVVPLKEVYADLKPHKIPDHQVDAALMSMYVKSNGTNPYLFLAEDTAYYAFLDGMVACNKKL
jgi:hypothetical protein